MNGDCARAYGRLMTTVNDEGPEPLKPDERTLVREAADALLFCEDLAADEEARDGLTRVGDLAGDLVASGRWVPKAGRRAVLVIIESSGRWRRRPEPYGSAAIGSLPPSDCLTSVGEPRSGTGSRCGRSRAARRCSGTLARASSRTSLPVVARRDVGEREHRHAGRGGQLRRPGGGRVACLGRARRLLLQEGRLVHEQIGLEGDEAGHLAGRRVSRQHHAAPAPRLAHHLIGPHAVDGLAVLEATEVGPRDDAQLAARAPGRMPLAADPPPARIRARATPWSVA